MTGVKNCDHCGAAFTPRPNRPETRSCSRACLRELLRADAAKRNTFTCERCGAAFHGVSRRRKRGCSRWCSRACANAAKPAGTAKYRQGGPLGQEHRRIAAKVLGRPIPDGVEVHHANGNGRDNAHTNLVICQDHAYHSLLHARTRIVKAGGNPNTQRICSACGRLRDLGQMVSGGKQSNACRECAAKRTARQRQKKRCPDPRVRFDEERAS